MAARRLALLVLALALGLAARAGAQAGNFTSTFVARWNLTHGKYLVDTGQYLEALEAFDTANEMTDVEAVRTEALLEKASVLALFLDASDEAVKVYDDLLQRYPKSAAAEAALFRAGMTLFDHGRYPRAAGYFARYLKQYPHGPSRGSAEFLLQQSRAKAGAAPAPPAPAPPAPPSITEVRVRILRGQRRIAVESAGTVTVTPGHASSGSLDVAAHAGLVSVGGQPGVREVTIGAGRPLLIHAGRITRHYRGRLTVRGDGDMLEIVNHLGLEEYLYGVVTKESVASWPPEALKAQAIASRTYALYQAQHRQTREYDMVDDEGSQVYGGVEGESAAGRRAVDATRGQVLEYRGRPIYAMFTANSGWYTEDPAFIFNQPLPYLTAKPDPYSPQESMGHWTRSYSAAEVRHKLAAIGIELGPIRAVEARQTDPSGRVVRVAIVDDRGAHVMRTRPTLGRALQLPEILVAVHRAGDQFTFTGGGFGHGVGLSQWGAKDMAQKGRSAKDILAFYYHDTAIAVPGH